MFESLKKRSLKISLVLTIILAAIGIGLAVHFALGAWYVVTGYVPFVNLDPDEISNQWVALNLKENWGSFADYTETDSNTHISKTVSVYYIIATEGDDDFIIDFRYMGVKVPASYENRMDQMAQHGAYNNPVFLSGRIRRMGNDVYRYFKDYMMDGGLTEEEFEQYTLPYYIEVYSDEMLENVCTVAAFLFGVLLIALAVFRLVKAMNGGYLRKLKADIASIGISEFSAESDWNSAVEICKGIKVGRLFTYYMEGSKPRAIPNSKVLWTYQNTTTHRTYGIKTGTTYSVMIWVDGWKNAANLSMPNEATAQEMLKRFSAQFPWVIVGYSDDLQQMYNKNRAQFMQLRYNTVEHTAAASGFGSYPF